MPAGHARPLLDDEGHHLVDDDGAWFEILVPVVGRGFHCTPDGEVQEMNGNMIAGMLMQQAAEQVAQSASGIPADMLGTPVD
jgi:hypothetical protein